MFLFPDDNPEIVLNKVDFPQPEGPEMMMILRISGELLNVLHLLPDLFDFAADQEYLLVNVQAAGFGGYGVGFALHFLGEEIGFAALAGDAFVKQQALQPLGVGAQAVDLLGEQQHGPGFTAPDQQQLDGRDIVLEHQAVRLNRRVYEKAGFDSGSVFSSVVRKYLDFVPHLAVHRRKMKGRILHGTG